MTKLISLLFLTCALLLGQYKLNIISFGPSQVGYNTPATVQLNTAGTWVAYAIPVSATMVTDSNFKIRAYASAVAGTLAQGNLRCDIFSNTADNTNKPSASLTYSTTVTTVPTGAGWVEFTGWSTTQTLTAGAIYHAVIQNLNATPASNNLTFRVSWGPYTVLGNTPTAGNAGWTSRKTTDSGSTWTQNSGTTAGLRIDYTGGSVGMPVQNSSTATSTALSVYGTRIGGAQSTSPAGARLRITCASAAFYRQGNPNFALKMRVSYGTTNVDGPFVAATSIVNTANNLFCLDQPAEIPQGTPYKVLIVGDGGGTSSSYYAFYGFQLANDPIDQALARPVGGWDYVYFNGTSWASPDPTLMPAINVWLDGSQPFGTVGGSGGGAYTFVQ